MVVLAHQDALVDPTVDDPAHPILLAVSDNGPQNDLALEPRIHVPVRDRPANRSTKHRPTRPGSRPPFGHIEAE